MIRLNPAQRVRWSQLYLALSFTTLATLVLELALTRIFSVVFYYHFAFLAISIALFVKTPSSRSSASERAVTSADHFFFRRAGGASGGMGGALWSRLTGTPPTSGSSNSRRGNRPINLFPRPFQDAFALGEAHDRGRDAVIAGQAQARHGPAQLLDSLGYVSLENEFGDLHPAVPIAANAAPASKASCRHLRLSSTGRSCLNRRSRRSSPCRIR